MKAIPRISVIVRVRNEENWLRHCLKGIREQVGVETEIIIVDNRSSDKSVEVAKRFGVDEIVEIEDYAPGRALNAGIGSSHGEFLAFISGHCIPADPTWLLSLWRQLEDHRVAGAYGRQLPMSFTEPIDRNDLMMAFGAEPRIQKKDWFFHNANSMIRRSVWEKFSFSEEAQTIEDRLWAKQVIEAGFWISYCPEARVYHHNGLHRTADKSRIPEHVRVVEAAVGPNAQSDVGFLKPTDVVLTAILPIKSRENKDPSFPARYSRLEACLLNSVSIRNVVVVSPEASIGGPGVIRMDRNAIDGESSLPIDEFLALVIDNVEKSLDIPDYYLYVNVDSGAAPEQFYDELVRVGLSEGLDTVFGAVREFGHFWVKDEGGAMHQVDTSFSPKTRREPLWRALYGVGTLVRPSILRSGQLIGARIGMIEVSMSDVGIEPDASQRLKVSAFTTGRFF